MDLIEGGPRPPVFAQGGQPAGDFPAYGADAVRWGLLAMSSAQDVKFSEDKVAQAQQLTNKLWNASRLILLRGRGRTRAPRSLRAPSRTAGSCRGCSARKADTSARIERFDFSHAALGLYDFVYGELCDWYLELVKPRLRAGEPELAAHAAARADPDARARASDHPVRHRGDLLLRPRCRGAARGGHPGRAARRRSTTRAEATLARLIEAVQALRGVAGLGRRRGRAPRSPPGSAQRRLRRDGRAPRAARAAVVRRARRRRAAGRVGRRSRAARSRSSPATSSTSRPPARKLAARREQLEAEIERAERKLANDGFVAKAPKDVVAAERDKLDAAARRAGGAVTPGGRRALPAVARAVRDAVRAGPHAAADDRAGPSAAAVSSRSTSSGPTASPRRCG